MPIANIAPMIIKYPLKSWLIKEELITEVPISNVGIEKGKTMMALKIADLPKDNAAPKAPNKLIKEVPSNKLNIIGMKLSKGRYKTKAAIIEAINIGKPVINQWINTLAKTKIKDGSKEIKKSSSVPSRKSSLNIVSTANRDANKAAIQITPGAKLLNRLSCGPRASGKKVTTIKKNIKGVM